MQKSLLFILCSILLVFINTAIAQIPAFPGAQGFGANAKGGRGGEVIYVTNLNDSGAGSLREAINTQGARTIIFRVGGTINLLSSLEIQNPLITIAGQTAPGDGITLRLDPAHTNSAMFIEAADIIIRHIRVRVGAASVGECCRDAITLFDGADRVIIDHTSLSWGTDETLNAWGTAKNITIQHSIISESLLVSSHEENGVIQRHSMGALFGDRANHISMHRNLLAHNNQRNPLINSDASFNVTFEHINNIVYNYGDFASVFDGRSTGTLQVNHIGNLYIPGENSRLNRWEVGVQPGSSTQIYVRDNIGPHRNAGDDEFAIVGSNINFIEQAPTSFQSITPFTTSTFPITASPVDSIFDTLFDDVGATLPRQDIIDQRVIDNVRLGEGEIINDPSEVGGWINAVGGTPYTDSDQDGMSDEWEIENNFNPNNSADRNQDPDNDGYTNLEEFLNRTSPTTDIFDAENQELCVPIKSASDAVSVICL